MTNENTKDIAQFSTLNWLHAHPFMSEWKIASSNIDHYKHTNNLAYLARLEQLAWEHSEFIGLTFVDYQALDRAMVITQHELNYHLPSHLGDTLICATWIMSCDKKFRLSRQFQYINAKNGKTIFTAKTQFVCVSLQTGVPKKMPDAFQKIYGHVALGS